MLTTCSTTLHLTLITCNTAYALFPIQTYLHNKSYNLNGRPGFGEMTAISTRYGTRVCDMPWPEEEEKSKLFTQERYIGDSGTWTIRLEATNDAPSRKFLWRPEWCYYSLKQMSSTPGQDWADSYAVIASTFRHCALMQQYTYSLGGRSEEFFNNLVKRRLDHLALQGLRTLTQSDLPQNWRDTDNHIHLHSTYLDQCTVGWNPPTYWTFHDDDLSSWRSTFDDYHRKMDSENLRGFSRKKKGRMELPTCRKISVSSGRD